MTNDTFDVINRHLILLRYNGPTLCLQISKEVFSTIKYKTKHLQLIKFCTNTKLTKLMSNCFHVSHGLIALLKATSDPCQDV